MATRETVWRIEPMPRYFAGIGFGARSRRIKAALLRGIGDGWNLRILAADAVTLPPAATFDFEFASSLDRVVRQLCEQSDASIDDVETLGLHELPIPEAANALAAALAEKTGVTVVTGFEHGDRAAGGRGGPLSAALDWLLFHSTRVHRLLVHLSAATEITYLPAASAAAQPLHFSAGPCSEFLDRFVSLLSHGKCPFDPGGHFAVQGSPHEPLIESWMSHPYLLKAPPKGLAANDFGESFCEDSVAFARERRLSAPDVLCSANHFIARATREAVHRWLPVGSKIDEVWVGGGALRNGLLWKLLRDRFLPIPIARTDDLGFPSEARPALHAALLAYLTLENLPGNAPALTGATYERVLGQIVPGSPANWDRWVCNVADRFEDAVRRAA